MAVLPWVCRRCSLQLLSIRQAATPSAQGTRDVARRQHWRTYATTIEEERRPIDWTEWFDSAAPYSHTSSGASAHDRNRKSHHDRDPYPWNAPIPLHSSFVPQPETLQQQHPPPPYITLQPPTSHPIVTILPPNQRIVLHDVAWVRRNVDYPLREDYPWAPDEVFSEEPSYRSLKDAVDLFKPECLRIHEHFKLKRGQSEKEDDYWKHQLVGNFVDGSRDSIIIVGESFNKLDAGVSSYLQLVASLHAGNLLRGPEDAGHMRTLSRMMQSEKKDWMAMVQVYNLAAHFGVLPTFEVRKVEEESGLAWHAAVSIETLDGLLFTGEASAVFYPDAELSACAELKRHIESVQSIREAGPIDLKTPDHVNIDNAPSILRSFTAKHPTARLETRVATESLPDGSLAWSVSYVLNDELLGQPCSMPSKEHAKVLADLIAAVCLTRRFPRLFDDYLAARAQAFGLQLPATQVLDNKTLPSLEPLMEPILELFRRGKMSDPTGQPSTRTLSSVSEQKLTLQGMMRHYLRRRHAHLSRIGHSRREENLRVTQDYYWYNPALDAVKKDRLALPIMQYRQEVLDAINNNTYSIIIGATASGKSTQVPQILFEDAVSRGAGTKCNIICTQPRRIAASSLARRVADERDEILGDVVGYQVGGEAVVSDLDGSITYMTPELLSVQLDIDEGIVLDSTSHVIIDEAHLKGFQTDRVITAVRNAIERRRAAGRHTPKLTIMSATLHAEPFEEYLSAKSKAGLPSKIPILEVPGRLHPVRELHLDDLVHAFEATLTQEEREFVLEDDKTRAYLVNEAALHSGYGVGSDLDEHGARPLIQWNSRFETSDRGEGPSIRLIAATVTHALRSTSDGDILVFLSSIRAINDVKGELERYASLYFAKIPKYKVLILHSMLPESVDEALQDPAEGERRIFLATDIAETSVTFSHVNQVVDTGRHRTETTHPVFGIDYLHEQWISKSSAVQRAGRAGRVRAGAYLALYTKDRRQGFSATATNRSNSPVNLMRPALRALKGEASRSLADYFASTFNAPSPTEIDATTTALQRIGAITPSRTLTNLGDLLASVPLTGRSALLVPLGMLFECLEPLLYIAASLEGNQLFRRGIDEQSARRSRTMRLFYARGTYSDQIAMLNACLELRQIRQDQGDEKAAQWATNSFIDYERFKSIQYQAQSLSGLLRTIGIFSASASFNKRADDANLIMALTAAALYPNIGVHQNKTTFTSPIGQPIQPSLYSAVSLQAAAVRTAKINKRPLEGSLMGFAAYQYLDHNSALVLQSSILSPLAVILFGSERVNIKRDDLKTLIVDNLLEINVNDEGTAQTIVRLKEAWNLVWRNALSDFTQGRAAGIVGVRDRRVRAEFVQNIVDLLTLEKDGLSTVADFMPEVQEPLDNLVGSRSMETFAAINAARPRDAFDELDEAGPDHVVQGGTDEEQRVRARPTPGPRSPQKASRKAAELGGVAKGAAVAAIATKRHGAEDTWQADGWAAENVPESRETREEQRAAAPRQSRKVDTAGSSWGELPHEA